MTQRIIIVILGLMSSSIALPLRAEPDKAAPASSSSDFSIDKRKKEQPWLWESPRRQNVPVVKSTSWPVGPEDQFILQGLEKAGLQPAPATDDRTWLRRVHFVITGLPPTRSETQAFLADTKPGARERAVDRLLASPHFGERWARHWMDLMRYAESRGHESDFIIANAWHYRDYLIRALNEDVTYDQFLLEHLAGDLMTKPRFRPGTDINESVLATGWAFLGEENHSPVDIRQDECERIDNKVDVFSKTFLGLTVSCARCHDHKFDPISAQDYYALSGFMLGSSFRQVRFEAMENNRKMADELDSLRTRFTPQLTSVVVASRKEGIEQIADYLLTAQEALSDGREPERRASLGNAQPETAEPSNAQRSNKSLLDPKRLGLWVEQLRDASTNAAHPLHSFASSSRREEAQTPKPGLSDWTTLTTDARIIADFTKPGQQAWKVDGEAFGSRPLAPGDVILGDDAANPIARVMTYGAARRDPFWNRIKNAPGNENDSGKLAATSRAGQMLRTPTVTLGIGKLHYLIRGKTLVYAAVDSHLMVEGPLHGRLVQKFDKGAMHTPRWVTHDLSAYSGHRTHVEFGPDGESKLEVLMVVEAEKAPKWLPTTFNDPVHSGARTPTSARIEEDKQADVGVRAPGINSLEDYAQEFQSAVAAASKQLSLGTLKNSPDVHTQSALANWLVQNSELFTDKQDTAVERVAKEFLAAQSNIASRVRWESHTAVAWFDGTGVDENILLRGKPTKLGEVAPRSLPVAFASAKPITTTASSGRYELARQLIDPSNPLVARTIVNRVWHHVFGRGIVASVDNFGKLGEPPTHPELLDHLTWQFVHEDGWSLKKLIRRLVLTQTFAMSSRSADARTTELDPKNTLLHHMPVRRLEAEVIRDALLAVSGRLDPAVGGPPVPVHLTEFLVGRGRPDKGGPLDGDGRRSVYIAQRRNFLPTLMQTFDTPTPFSTVGKRNVTNVPGQSLALMNNPLFHEQAEVWAKRLLKETPGEGIEDRVRWLFESAYVREPSTGEVSACLKALTELRGLHSAPDDQSVEVWGDLCHALLNANDFIYVK